MIFTCVAMTVIFAIKLSYLVKNDVLCMQKKVRQLLYGNVIMV